MGIYVNPDSSRLRTDMNDDIYVDKSMILSELNKLYSARSRFLCVSRPRRFGKTMVGNLIATYYSCGAADSRAIFEHLKVAATEGWDAHLGEACVIKVDLNSFYERFHAEGGIVEKMMRKVVAELRVEYPDAEVDEDAPLPAVPRRHPARRRVVRQEEQEAQVQD